MIFVEGWRVASFAFVVKSVIEPVSNECINNGEALSKINSETSGCFQASPVLMLSTSSELNTLAGSKTKHFGNRACFLILADHWSG